MSHLACFTLSMLFGISRVLKEQILVNILIYLLLLLEISYELLLLKVYTL